MKIRVTGLVLAILAAASLAVPAFASDPGNHMSDFGPAGGGISLSAMAPSGIPGGSPFVLNGSVLYGLDYEAYHNTNYITVESFVAAVDRSAVVEEENGVVVVTSDKVEQIVPVLVGGSLVIPASSLAGGGAANVEEETLSLKAKKGNRYVEVNGRVLYVEHGVILVEGKVALPVRVLAEIFNLDVEYRAKTQTVLLTSQKEGGAYLEDGETFYDEDVLYWLSRIIYSESGNQPLSGMIAVGNVVMNRVASPDFPNNIYDVLFQKNQFSPAMSGSIYRTPSAASVRAAKMVLDGAVALEDVLFFNQVGMNTRAARNRPFVATIGGHSFYA